MKYMHKSKGWPSTKHGELNLGSLYMMKIREWELTRWENWSATETELLELTTKRDARLQSSELTCGSSAAVLQDKWDAGLNYLGKQPVVYRSDPVVLSRQRKVGYLIKIFGSKTTVRLKELVALFCLVWLSWASLIDSWLINDCFGPSGTQRTRNGSFAIEINFAKSRSAWRD